MTLIHYHSYKNKLQADSRVTYWPSTERPSMTYSSSTLQSLSRGTRSYAFSRSIKACEDILYIIPKFLIDLPQSENLICGAATWTKTTLAIVQF